jgi:hypothetical protein
MYVDLCSDPRTAPCEWISLESVSTPSCCRGGLLSGARICRAPGYTEDVALGKHSKTSKGRIRRERGDALAKNLREEYPEFNKVHGSTRLDTLRKRYNTDSLNGVRKALRKEK